MRENTKAFFREIVAPTAARLALAPVAAQFRGEGLTRDAFLALCGEAYDGARVASDEPTEPGAPKPSDPPVTGPCDSTSPVAYSACELEHGHEGAHRCGAETW